MLVARKLSILPHLLAQPARLTKLANFLANPLIDQYARRDVAASSTLAEYTLNGYSSSAGHSHLLTSIHISYKAAFRALSYPCKFLLTYGAFIAV